MGGGESTIAERPRVLERVDGEWNLRRVQGWRRRRRRRFVYSSGPIMLGL